MWFALLILFCALSTAKLVPLPGHLPLYLWPLDNGAMAAIVMAGVITSTIFLGRGSRPSSRTAMTQGVVLGLAMLIAGRLFTPLGISKIRATPTWALYSVGAAILIFTILYWVCDVKRWTRWAALFRPAGANTLLCYLLPDLWFFLALALGWKFLETHYRTGAPAVAKTLLFTLLVLVLAAVLTRARVRLQL